jgi:aryl-alcohol dehydrogenase-like predicted oxidoreductase
MEYRFLGKTGMLVSELCLGAMTFGRESTETESIQMLDMFVNAGGNFIDTANVYSQGGSEEILGRWLKGKQRNDFIITSKVRWGMGKGPNDLGLSRKHISAAIDGSLHRLGTDFIDLYQVHGWDNGAPLEETLSTLNGLVKAGKVRYLGVSNYAGFQLQKAIDISLAHNWEPYICLQPLYNLLDRAIEWELIPVCQNEGLGIIPWSPLRGGWLSGKYKRGMTAPLANTRLDDATRLGWSEGWSVYGNEHTWKVLDALLEVSKQVGKEPAQVALRWLLQRPGVTAPIIGARTVRHLESNLGAVGWTLSNEHMSVLTKASEIEVPYPYSFMAGWKRR